MPSIRVGEIVIDNPRDQTRALLDFYAALTGFTPYFNETSPSLLENDKGADFGLQSVDDYQAPTWPTQERGQQIHLDFATDDIKAAVALAESMGAKRAPNQGDHGFVVMLDPVGHPFCFVQHHDNVDGDRRPARENGLSIKVRGPFIDCADQHALAEFYLALLGGQITLEPDDEYLVIVTESGQALAFQRVEGYQPPTWPTQERGQQLHMDMAVDDLAAAKSHAISCGATVAFEPGEDAHFVVMRDPAGHPFCLGQY